MIAEEGVLPAVPVSFAGASKAPQHVHAQIPASPRMLVLSVSAGSGHVRAAEAIRAAAALEGVGCVHIDVMQHVPRLYRKLYTDAYIGLVNRYPAIWGWLYHRTDREHPKGIVQLLRRRTEQLLTRRIVRLVREMRPEVVVCTHFLPAEILAAVSGLPSRLWVQVTDFDVHRAWIHPRVTGYFAANEEVAFRMRAIGIPANAVHVTGIPVMPAFAARHDRRACAAMFGLDPSRRIVLLMGGGAGVGGLADVAAHLLRLEQDFQLVVLAGRNQVALRDLQQLAHACPGRLFPLGFTDRVERLMACADFAITKPGGLSTSECLAQGLPMILHAPIPGQEERNAAYLLEQGIALNAFDATTLEFRVRELLSNAPLLAAMRERAHAIARPAAGAHVIRALGVLP